MEVAGGVCERHTGGQPGGAGGICAICLQEKLTLVWRGEGHFKWGTAEEFSVTPPLEYGEGHAVDDGCESVEPHRACFPVLFRAARDNESKREKIDRNACEIRSIMRELAALHEKKKQKQKQLEAAPKKSKQVETAPVATGSILEEDDAKDTKTTLCLNALWPVKLNMKWANYLVSPIVSSNKIAPSKSDLLAKIVKAATVEKPDCDIDRTQTFPAVALLPPRFVQPAVAERESAAEIDKETAMRMEASRITVMTWLQSLPSPKAAPLALGDGMLEMCDEEEVEVVDSQQQQSQEVNNDQKPQQVDLNSSHLVSFGKFLRTPLHVSAPTRMVDIEIAAQ